MMKTIKLTQATVSRTRASFIYWIPGREKSKFFWTVKAAVYETRTFITTAGLFYFHTALPEQTTITFTKYKPTARDCGS